MVQSRLVWIPWVYAGLLLPGVIGPKTLLRAQMAALPKQVSPLQAWSQDEFDSYMRVITAKDPHAVLQEATAFLEGYPRSELVGIVYQAQMQAFQALGDWKGMLTAGQRALISQPDNLNTLLALAPALVNHPEAVDRPEEMLGLADQYARRALAVIETTRPPREVGVEQWKGQKREMQSRAHEVLGIVALGRRQAKAAVEEFQATVRLSPSPQGPQMFRLGVASELAGQNMEAAEAFERAAELGPANVRMLAQQELRKLPAQARPPVQ